MTGMGFATSVMRAVRTGKQAVCLTCFFHYQGTGTMNSKLLHISPARRTRQGFSLVESMIVIVLFGIVAAIAAPPMFRYLQSNRLQTNADRLIADLQYARAVSIASGDVMQFNNDNGGYTVTNMTNGNVLRQTNFEHGLGLAANQTTNFYPWGMADSIVLNISNGNDDKQIAVLPTGIVEAQ